MKVKKRPNRSKPAANLNKTRKQIRKDLRKQKKARRNDYYTNRNKGGKFVLNPDTSSKNALLPKPRTKSGVKLINPKQDKILTSEEQLRKTLQNEKKEHAKLKRQMLKQRKEQLNKANDEEDRNIKRLEKQLRLTKRKTKTTPKSFTEDGLDYLLEVCDSDNMKAAVEAEQQLNEVNDDFDEDFALMSGRKIKKGKMLVMEESQEDTDRDDNFDDDDQEEEGLDSAEEKSELSDEEMNFSDDDDTEMYIDADDKAIDCIKSDDSSKDDDAEGVDDEAEPHKVVWEDIYGRLRGKDGNIIVENTSTKYIPPAIRAKINADSSSDKKRSEKLNTLRKQLKGLLNRLAERNMHNIASQMEQLYMNNSRNDMNDTLTSLILDSIVTTSLAPERLLLEHVLLITVLHANVGTEVGAHFLQNVIKRFEELYQIENSVGDKMLDNIVCVIAQLYNYKVFHVQLIYEVLTKLSNRFNETDIECILLILKSVGFNLRKDDPLALKNLIVKLQQQANSAGDDIKENARVKFMLDILLAVKNNNMSKIPNYDTSYSEHLKKLLKGFIRKGCYVTTLNIGLEDLIKADEYGKWWVVGSAWTGKTESDQKIDNKQSEEYSHTLLDLARKQRMNTDIRRNIFCIIMSAEDYMDAFEKLLHLSLKNQQEREIIHVLLHCCLQEQVFNPYYAVLAQKFCEYDRKYQMTIKYSIWDKLKALTECSANQLSNLAKLLTHLFIEKGLPISTLKIIEFGELDKITLRFMRQILIGILLHKEEEACQSVFINVALSDKLKMFTESLRLFIRHFLIRNLKSDVIPEEQKELLQIRTKAVDKLLSVTNKKVRF